MHALGQTRSANRRDHLLLTPDTFVRTPLPGLAGGLAIVHVAPAAGAAFTQMTVEFDPEGVLIQGRTQRLIYVLEGELTLEVSKSELASGESKGELSIDASAKPEPRQLTAGSYAYFPIGYLHKLTARTRSRVAVIDKPFVPLDPGDAKELGAEPYPWFLTGREPDIASVALNGDEGLQVRSLLPNFIAFDFACNTMTYAPGAALSQVEIHYMEHGLLMLQGGGIYRLGESWYPTTAGDFIWMAPYCPQWFGALGKTPAKYLIYKDFNRRTLL